MKNAIFGSAAALALGLLACGGQDGSSSTLESIPDAEALTLEVTGAAAETAATPPLAAAATAEAVAATWPETGDDLAAAQRRIAAVNGALRSALQQVAAVAATNGAPAGGAGRWYGPAERCTVEVAAGEACPEGASATFRLWVGNAVGRGGAFVLQAKGRGADDASYLTVFAGWMRRGAMARRGVGQIWLDLGHLVAAAPAFPGQGVLHAGFAAGPVAKAERLALVGFTPDATNPDWPAATVAMRGFKTAAGTARVRVAALKDLVPTTSDTELGLAHVVYRPDLGGRAFAIVTDYVADGVTHGDVPADQYFFGRACYAPHAPTAPVFKQWFLCPKAEGPAACVADAANPSTVVAGTSWAADCAVAGEPAEFAPPAGAPGTDPAAAPGALPGEDASGMTPEDPPASDGDAPTP